MRKEHVEPKRLLPVSSLRLCSSWLAPKLLLLLLWPDQASLRLDVVAAVVEAVRFRVSMIGCRASKQSLRNDG